MGSISAGGVDAWLRGGGTVVAASERAARAVRTAFHHARRSEGLGAWPSPLVMDWNTFVRQAWLERAADERLLLNSVQEESLWSRIIDASPQTAGWPPASRRRLAQLAMEAHDLLCAYAPHLLQVSARSEWQQDAAALSRWLSEFDQACRTRSVMSPSRLPLELLSRLETSGGAACPPLVLAGFDRLLPAQKRLLDAWGDWREIALGETTSAVQSCAAANEQAELAACALWCSRHLENNPAARILVITHDASKRRGQIERAFLKHGGAGQPPRFEFSLGVPLNQVGLARSANLLLRWLDSALDEHELDWLLGSATAATTPAESSVLQSILRALRRHGLERTHWTLDAFVRHSSGSAQRSGSTLLPATWVQRMTQAQRRLLAAPQTQSPLDWAGLVPQLLEAIGWPGPALTSAEFQALSRWQQAVDTCGSLGFDGSRMSWAEFRSALDRMLSETLFAEESQDGPVQIAGPAESAGLTAEAIWFLGADEDAWPAGGRTHPLLPIEVQRTARMPHASPLGDWELAQSITTRLLAAAPQVFFCYAQQKDGVEMRPSRLVSAIAGAPRPLPSELAPEAPMPPLTISFEDRDRMPVAAAPSSAPAPPSKKTKAQLSLFDDAPAQPAAMHVFEVPGGANVLTAQSQCPFKAFATTRLGAQSWEPAQAGLTPAQRGQLLHAVLHSVWGGPAENGIRTLAELKGQGPDLRPFVHGHVQRAMDDGLPPGAREQMPQRYLELEEQRLTNLATAWLEYELKRVEFTVDSTEVDTRTAIAGLALNLRLDRIDRLKDGSLLVIDYKTGNVSPRSWDLPRPDDVQLPLYAAFALNREQVPGGLVFAKVRPGDLCFVGKVRDAAGTIEPSLDRKSGLVRYPLTSQQLSEWKAAVEQLALDFIAGRADVDPREYPATCERCGLYTLCRVKERLDEAPPEDEESGLEESDE